MQKRINKDDFARNIEIDETTTHNSVGKSALRPDAWAKVTGQERYMEDIQFPNAIWGKILRSPHPHAKILSIDTSAAEKFPGVKSVITFKDIVPFKIGFADLADQYALCDDRARFVGDEVAAVAALDEETAEKALDLIRVEYEILPMYTDAVKAMELGATVLHEEKGTNVAAESHYEYGNTDEGFAQADHVFEDTFETQRQCHVCMEVHGCVADWGKGNQLSVWTSTQSPHIVKRYLAEATGLPISKVRVNRVGVGGAFGSRTDILPHDIIASYLSKKAGRPVKLLFSRQEEFYASVTRHPAKVTIKTGVKNGKITTRHVTAIVNGGAYTTQTGAVMGSLGWKAANFYQIDNYKYDGYGVLTNTTVSTAYRGYGGPQVGFALESQIDMIAKKLRLDPLEFRINNANQTGDITIAGSLLSSCGLTECIEKTRDSLKWSAPKSNDQGRGIAIGFGETGWRGAYYNNSDVSAATIKMNQDASVHVIVGGSEIGVGYDGVMGQIAAQTLGLPYEQVTVHSGDTDLAAYDCGMYASRGTITSATAIVLAAAELKKKLQDGAAEILGIPADHLNFVNGTVVSKEDTNNTLPLREIARYIYEDQGGALFGTGVYDPGTHLADENGYYQPPGASITYPFCAVSIDVDVNRKTGQFKINKLAAAVDCGRAINPVLAEGQIEGDVFHGLGMASVEPGLEYDASGQPVYTHLVDYKLLTAADMPPIDSILVESIDPVGPFGIKGITQIVTSTVGASLANAIYDAVGVRIMELPITPEKVLTALKDG
ncbi:molybdopterin-dependent oxidoreductase [Rhodobacteraceae bacterium Araon29]